ncbi:MAG: amino acid racemase [Sphaerobacter sp.]|nr:amino acid racemase [Sphaerobacter sp.]
MTARRTIGVLGGMGPLATADLYQKIIAATPAQRDQDHLHVIIDADPTVPDRTAALLHGGPDPTPWLVAGARRLAAAGADFIVIPCNTAHAFLGTIRDAVPIPILSMVDETAAALAALLPPGAPAGILATAGTVAVGLYQTALAAVGLDARVPSPEAQTHVDAAIAAVKAGDLSRASTDRALRAAQELVDRGARALVAACTELPLILRPEDVPVPLVDPTAVLAQAAVRVARDARVPLEGGTPHAVRP